MNIGIGALSWSNERVLRDSLKTWEQSGLLKDVEEKTIVLQEGKDYNIDHYLEQTGWKVIKTEKNVHIAGSYKLLLEQCKTDYWLFLEHDWASIKGHPGTELEQAISLLELPYIDAVRLRSRELPGEPIYSKEHRENMINKCPEHLFDCVHWLEDKDLPLQIAKRSKNNQHFYVCEKKWAAFTNNPTLYKTQWIKEYLKPWLGNFSDLEKDVVPDWIKRPGLVARTEEGCFTHAP